MKWLILCLIVVLQVPLPKWKAMPENDRNNLRAMIIHEFCQTYAEKKGVCKFKIWEDIKDGVLRLHIDPEKTEI
jgi:hypothetical protein